MFHLSKSHPHGVRLIHFKAKVKKNELPDVKFSLMSSMQYTTVSLTFRGPCIVSIFQYMSNKMQHYTVYLYLETALMFRVVSPHIIRSTRNSIYRIWYLSNRYWHLPLSWKRWKWNSSIRPVAWMRWKAVPPHPGYRPAASSVHYTTSCKHSLALLKTGVIIARNMLSCLELLMNRYCCV